jgi:hypothetical protein
MADETQSDRSWWDRYWVVDDAGKIPWPRLLWIGLLAAVLSYLVLYYGGEALKSYHELRGGNLGPPPPPKDWSAWLNKLSIGGGIAIGALIVAWRLIYRTDGQSHLGTALALIAVLLFGIFVWPTPWTYKQFGCTVFQIDRIRGHYTEVTKVPFCEPAPAAARN